MNTKPLILAVLMCGICLPQTALPVKSWANLDAEDIAKKPEFFQLPLAVRYNILLSLDKDFGSLQPDRQEQIILNGEPSGFNREYFLWEKTGPGMDGWSENGHFYQSVNTPAGLKITATHFVWEKYFSLVLKFENIRSEFRFDVDPSRISIISVSKEPVMLRRMSPQDLSKRFDRGARWASAMNAMGASMARQRATVNTTGSAQATIRGRYDRVEANGTYSSQTVITAPDYDRQRQAAHENQQRINAAQQRGQNVFEQALKAHTLFSGGQIVGNVDFEMGRGKHQFLVIRVLVNDMSVEFPLYKTSN